MSTILHRSCFGHTLEHFDTEAAIDHISRWVPQVHCDREEVRAVLSLATSDRPIGLGGMYWYWNEEV